MISFIETTDLLFKSILSGHRNHREIVKQHYARRIA